MGGNRRIATGNRRIVTGNRRIAIGNRRIATGNRRIMTGNRRIAIGNRRITTGSQPKTVGEQCPFDAIDQEIDQKPCWFKELRSEDGARCLAASHGNKSSWPAQSGLEVVLYVYIYTHRPGLQSRPHHKKTKPFFVRREKCVFVVISFIFQAKLM